MGTENGKEAAKNTTAAVGGGATAATAAAAILAAADFLPTDLTAELSEKILSGGLTINSVVTAILVWVIAHNRKKVARLQNHLDELTHDADRPPRDTSTSE